MFGGKGRSRGTPLSNAVLVVFTEAAKSAGPYGALLKTISRSMRHRGQLPWSFEICHLPSPNDGSPVCADTRNGRTKTLPVPVSIDTYATQRMSGEKTAAHSLTASASSRCGLRSPTDSAHKSFPVFAAFSV